MVRMATTAAALVLGLTIAGTALAAERPARDVAAAQQQIAAAEADWSNRAYDRVVEGLAPTVDPEVYATLPETVQYAALGLFARALYRLGAWDQAHDALVDLTTNPNATDEDWALRAETAMRIGDDEDAELASAMLEGDAADDTPSIAA